MGLTHVVRGAVNSAVNWCYVAAPSGKWSRSRVYRPLVGGHERARDGLQ